MGLRIHRIWRPAVNTVGVLVLVIGSFVSLSLAYSIGTHFAEAATPPDNCFSFSAGVINSYYSNENNDSEQPACPVVIDIPNTISGTAVTTIGESAFNGSGATAIHLPTSITAIQATAFAGLTLNSLTINSTNSLTLEPNSLSGLILSSPDLAINTGGDLLVNATLSGMSITGELQLNAGGSVTTTNGMGGSFSAAALTITATSGDITMTNGSFAGSTIGAVSINSNDDATIHNGSFSGAASSTLSIESGGDTLLNGGLFSTLTGDISIDAGGDIFLDSGALASPGIGGGTLSFESGGLITINSALHVNSLTSMSFVAGTGLTITSALTGNASLSTLHLATATGPVNVINGSFTGNISQLSHLSIDAPQGLNILQSFYNAKPGLQVDLNLGGDVTIGQNAFPNAQLDSFDIVTDGLITIDDTAFGGTGYIKSVDWRAGDNLTLIGPLEGMGSGSWWGNQYYSGFTTAVNLEAGNNLSIGDNIFAEIFNLTSLSLTAGGTAYFGDNIFSYGKITSLTLPADTTTIGAGAFSFNNLDAVYLQGATPTIGNYAFSFSGVTTTLPSSGPPSGHEPVEDFENVRYVQLYTDTLGANPGGYSHTAYTATPVGMSDEPLLDRLSGGYIVNPSTYTAHYRSSNGATIAPSSISGTGQTLSDYLVSSNPTANFALYYLAGTTTLLTAPTIDGYTAPTAHTLSLMPGLNAYAFVYEPIAAENEATPAESLSDTGSDQIVSLIASSILIIGASLAVIRGINS